eukprot:11664-Eustigmatos_ZCMA.PRE.1
MLQFMCVALQTLFLAWIIKRPPHMDGVRRGTSRSPQGHVNHGCSSKVLVKPDGPLPFSTHHVKGYIRLTADPHHSDLQHQH